MRKQTRKAYEPEFRVMVLTRDEWLWVIMPNFKTAEDAEAWIKQAHERDSQAQAYRVDKA